MPKFPVRFRLFVVSGKPVKTVEVHAHCIVPEAAQLINRPLGATGLLWSMVGDRLAQMDQSGVDVQAPLSLSLVSPSDRILKARSPGQLVGGAILASHSR